MASLPQNNNFQYQQTYQALYVTGNMDIQYRLANSTGATYQPGLLMCLYTAGPSVGLAGDYLSTGTNGQNVCIGVFDDQNYPFTTNGTATTQQAALVRVAGQGQGLIAAALSATGGSGDITTGMTSLDARLITAPNGNFWYWP